jgi:hypothetical protein
MPKETDISLFEPIDDDLIADEYPVPKRHEGRVGRNRERSGGSGGSRSVSRHKPGTAGYLQVGGIGFGNLKKGIKKYNYVKSRVY